MAKMLNGGSNRCRRQVAGAQCNGEPVHTVELEAFCDLVYAHVSNIEACQFPLQHFAALSFVLIFVSLTKPGSDLGATAVCSQIAQLRVQPVTARLRLAAGNDLDLVAVLYPVCQGNDAAVYLGAATSMSNLRMHVVGEVQRRGASRQVYNVTFRTDGVDTVLEKPFELRIVIRDKSNESR